MYNRDTLLHFIVSFHQSKREKLLTVFITSFKVKAEMCKKAEEERNLDLLHAAMHDTKTLSYTIGYTELGDLAKTIEEAAIGKLPDKAFSEVKNIYPLIDEITGVINDYLCNADNI